MTWFGEHTSNRLKAKLRQNPFTLLVLPLLRISGVLYWGMPFYSTLLWWRTMTPTTTGLNTHYDKKQNQSYAGSFHRAVLLAFNIYSPVLSLPPEQESPE